MRMAEEDARTRRDHARRNGSATEYDALHGLGSYGRKAVERLRARAERLLLTSNPKRADTTKRGTPHIW
jgi:hypothetical protein